MCYIVKTVSIVVRGLDGKARCSETDQVESSMLYILYSRNYEYNNKRAK
jgi:hypothetical protein